MKIEESNDMATLIHIKNSAEYEYARLVQEGKEKQKGTQKKEKNPRVEECKIISFPTYTIKSKLGIWLWSFR